MSGQGWQFSHLLDERDYEFLMRDFVTISDATDYYGMSYRPLVRIAKEAGAILKIGKMVRIDRKIFDEYLRKIRRIPRIGGKLCAKS